MEKWRDAPALVANTFGAPAAAVWLLGLAPAFEQCLQVAPRSRSCPSRDQLYSVSW